jgi:hypothetical protein
MNKNKIKILAFFSIFKKLDFYIAFFMIIVLCAMTSVIYAVGFNNFKLRNDINIFDIIIIFFSFSVIFVLLYMIFEIIIKEIYLKNYNEIEYREQQKHKNELINYTKKFISKLDITKPTVVYVSYDIYLLMYMYNSSITYVYFVLDEDRKEFDIGLHKKKDLINEPLKFFERE